MKLLRECAIDVVVPATALFLAFWAAVFLLACRNVLEVTAGVDLWRVLLALGLFGTVSAVLLLAAFHVARWWWLRPATDEVG